MEQTLHQELAELNTEIAKLGGLVEDAIGKALISLRDGDRKLAKSVRKEGDSVDDMEVAIEQRCLHILACYQPVARDLRFIVTILKVNNELEHIGDLAENISRKTKTVAHNLVENTRMDLFKMGERTKEMVTLALDALIKRDIALATKVIQMDDEVDLMHRRHHDVIGDLIEKHENELSSGQLGLLSVSRSLERIADMATSIAEDVVYYLKGDIVRHRRSFGRDD